MHHNLKYITISYHICKLHVIMKYFANISDKISPIANVLIYPFTAIVNMEMHLMGTRSLC